MERIFEFVCGMSKKWQRDDGKNKIRMRQNFANIEMAI